MSFYNLKNHFVFILLSLLVCSCSSIINGTTQKISVNSNVQGADVTIDGVSIGRTPVVNARIKRKDTSLLIVKKEGYKDFQQSLQTRMDPWFWGNFVIGGGLGSTTDLVSGTTHLLDPDTIFVQMEKLNKSSINDEQDRIEKLRSFVTTSYSQLAKEIKSKKGEYLKSLLKLLNVPFDREQFVIEKLNQLLAKSETIVDFVEEVSNFNFEK